MPSWSTVRDDFPILHQQVHGKPLVYLDNAATTQKPRSVIDALVHYYERDNANVHRGLHALSTRATDAYEGARARIARFLNAADPAEIIFTRGTTESVNVVARSLAHVLKPGDVILSTEMEHHSNLVPWQQLARATGAKLRFVPIVGADAEGGLDLAALDRLLTPEVKVFAFTHLSNTLGTINPIAELCARARAIGALTVIDAAQSGGHAPLDVRALGCDYLVLSGHKMCGPTGIGVLYGKRELLDRLTPTETGGGMVVTVHYEDATWKPSPERFEAGTPNIAGAIGLAAACDYLDALGRDAIARHDHELGRLAYEKLAELPGIRLIGPRDGRSGVVSFAFEGVHAHDVVTFADEDGIALRGGHHCNQPLMRKLGLTSTTRASFYLYNTPEEIDALVASLRKILKFFGVS
ncbi:aminotransferase class V-fold PLP-dependent enzyme [Opitutus terrae]|uniref:Cysteine desulfurase n=1 Tax=Opitutus terrae (strain DSM 11246 / JCM 15787 / PB90-1) TaxID=452637 RepID=B1ZTE9_OPITP|nr:SufS family cysteine desulfurase [Opitutus terrae]ACB73894.1 cysteine desulfurase, SufS subfamily [Opitutus terrae PB90-1]